jgi:hypothetical protein
VISVRPARAAREEFPATVVLIGRKAGRGLVQAIALEIDRHAILAKTAAVEAFAVAANRGRLDILIEEFGQLTSGAHSVFLRFIVDLVADQPIDIAALLRSSSLKLRKSCLEFLYLF